MFDWLSKIFARAPATPAAPPAEPAAESWFIRRWEAADTNRLNSGHWANARGQSINADLSERLKTLRLRCAYEAANNPFVEGNGGHSIEARQNVSFAGLFSLLKRGIKDAPITSC